MSEYQFTQDWFGWAPPVWEQLIPMLPARQDFLEIGSFEGRSTVWIVENMMENGGSITCIDTWAGGEEHINGEANGIEARFDRNMKLLLDKYSDETGVHRVVWKEKGFSTHKLAELVSDRQTFDFIYIDGSHIARDVLTDACMAWPLLKSKGLMVFDDYLWGEPRDILHRPKPAIDAFTNLFAEELNIIHVGYQLVIQKK